MSATHNAIAAEWERIVMYVRIMMPQAQPVTVEDVAATVVEKALRAADTHNGCGDHSLLSWLYRIAKNAVTDHWRSQSYRNHLPLSSARRASTDAGSELHATVMDVQAAVSSLSAQQQQYCHMRMAGYDALSACRLIGMAEEKSTASRKNKVVRHELSARLESAS